MLSLIDALKGIKVLVVGDPIVDLYHWGHVDRISPEAPIPVFVEEKWTKRPGGADNVLRQLRTLECDARAHFPLQPWETKHRYMVGGHQLFRCDQEVVYKPEWVDPSDEQIVVLSDYNKGFLRVLPEFNVPVIVDPKGSNWLKYEDCEVICPNEREYAGWDKKGHFPRMIIKQGSNGMIVVDHGVKTHVPAQVRHVADVTGAGDTVVAVVAAALGAGASLVEAAQLASIAAGYVVGEVGTTVCPVQKLRELCS